MSLEAKFVRLDEGTTELVGVRQGFNVAQGLSSRAHALREVAEVVRPVRAAVRLLESYGVDVPILPIESHLRKQIAEVSAATKAQPYSPESYPIGGLQRAATKWAEEAKLGAIAAWQTFVSANVPPVSEQILSILAPVPSLQEPIRQIRRAQEGVRALSIKLPGDQDFLTIAKHADTIREAYSKIDTEDLDEEVRNFLRAFGSGGAVLSLLTPKVLAWIDRHGLLEEFRVVPRVR